MQNKWFTALVALLVGLPLMLAFPSDSDARRMGSGKSFGSKPTYSKRSADSSQSTASQSAASRKNDTVRNQLSRRGGLMGLLGGLALGGLLGSLLFGGAFENINFFDILILGGLAFLAYRIFASKKAAQQRPAGAGGISPQDGSFEASEQAQTPEDYRLYQREPYYERNQESNDRSFDTDLMKDQSGQGQSDVDVSDSKKNVADGYDRAGLPAGFNQEDFLNGAKSAYYMMQKAWDDGEMSELRALMTDRVFAEVQEQFQQRGDGENITNIMKLDAELLQARERDNVQEASVLFNAVMSESATERPQQVKEIWHFIKKSGYSQNTWLLDGIQQLDD